MSLSTSTSIHTKIVPVTTNPTMTATATTSKLPLVRQLKVIVGLRAVKTFEALNPTSSTRCLRRRYARFYTFMNFSNHHYHGPRMSSGAPTPVHPILRPTPQQVEPDVTTLTIAVISMATRTTGRNLDWPRYLPGPVV